MFAIPRGSPSPSRNIAARIQHHDRLHHEPWMYRKIGWGGKHPEVKKDAYHKKYVGMMINVLNIVCIYIYMYVHTVHVNNS